MPASLPLIRRIQVGDLGVKKGGRVFGEDRQLGLAREQSYEFYFDNGVLSVDDVPDVTLRGGGLKLKSGTVWSKASAVDIALRKCHQEFLAEDVKADHAFLSKAGFTVTGVDRPKRNSKRNSDVQGFFWTEAPVRGTCTGEKKMVFGRSNAAFDKALEKHQDDTLEEFNSGGGGFDGQLLLVTQVSGSAKPVKLKTKVFYTTGEDWTELRPPKAEALTFDTVWSKCSAHKSANGVELVAVSDFLAFAGETNKHVLERLSVWSKGGLGVKKSNFVKKKLNAAGSGSSERWCASKSTLYKVWPALRTRFSKKRRA